MVSLNREQVEILEHTAHRAAAGLFCGDSLAMQQLVELGLMEPAGRKSFVPDPYFRITLRGRRVLNGQAVVDERDNAGPEMSIRRPWDAQEMVLPDGKAVAFSGDDLIIGDQANYSAAPIRIKGQDAVRSLRCFLTSKCQEWDHANR